MDAEESKELKLQIIVEARCGETGHRERASTVELNSKQYWCSGPNQDVKEFTQACIH